MEMMVTDPQLVGGGIDALRGIELGREDPEVEIGEQRAEQDHAVALLDESRHLFAAECPFVEPDIERMHLADHALGEQRRRHRDPRRLRKPHHVFLKPVPVQLDAGDDHGPLRLLDPGHRLLHRLRQRARIALHQRRRIGTDLIRHHAHHVARQFEVHRSLQPMRRVEQVVDVAKRRRRIDDLAAHGTDLLEHVELRVPLPHAVVEQRIVHPLTDARRTGNEHDGAFLGIGAGDRIGEAQPTHAIRHAHRPHAIHAGIGIGRESRTVLAGAVHEIERAVLEHAVEGKHIVAGQPEHVPDAIVGEPADQILPDRKRRDAPLGIHRRPSIGPNAEPRVEHRPQLDRHEPSFRAAELYARCVVSTRPTRLRAPHIPSPDVRLRPPGYGSLGPACAPASCLRWSATPAPGIRGAQSLLNWNGEAAETVGAMRKSRRADTRLTPSAPSQLRLD